jgi:hypothetical protein
VEAMYLSLPVISFDVSYNRETTLNKALFFKNEQDLINVLSNTCYEHLQAVAKELNVIAKEKYTWHVISKKYSSLIEAFDFKYEKQSLKEKLSYGSLLKTGHAHLDTSKLFIQSTPLKK